eukprot:NODE_5827_length_549_cov_46.942000_g5084_i0.p2 GENE.NODE_5827_length_549_cov_46.942000_g5084_i0~~NODE_5827_length_549_cov_46.942000_g5084_i0.p2  ORF type:complete len:108 (-),score=15.10 NODE_5827_length_549_cov_46.942000_g5084_i0:194-517(-)
MGGDETGRLFCETEPESFEDLPGGSWRTLCSSPASIESFLKRVQSSESQLCVALCAELLPRLPAMHTAAKEQAAARSQRNQEVRLYRRMLQKRVEVRDHEGTQDEDP